MFISSPCHRVTTLAFMLLSTSPILAAPQSTDTTAPPVVFNASTSARAGDVVSLQGENFGSAVRVSLDSAPTKALAIVNRVGSIWLAVQIPLNARGALTLRLHNDSNSNHGEGSAASAPVKLNAALPLHLDALQLVPGGVFRVFGRNLLLPGSTPRVSIDGMAARIDRARSDEHMLTVTAPSALRPTSAAALRVDNGNGSGAALLDRPIQVVAGAPGDPFTLGVGWAAGFASIATRSVDAASDSRLQDKLACDGRKDDSGALQRAIDLAAATGGAVLRLPAGRCRLARGVNLRSNVVLQGAGKTATELVYSSNYPLSGVKLELVGIRNLTLTNAGASTEGPMLKDSARVFIQNVRIGLGTSRQMYWSGNRQFVVAQSEFEQTGSISHQGPYTLNGSSGLVFEGNTTRWVDGAPAFGRIHDSLLRNNRFTRDARSQNQAGVVVHSMTLDFAYRVAVLGNSFDLAHGPITNMTRNDGEAVLTEGGGAARTENMGRVASAGANTLTDPANTLQTDPFGNGNRNGTLPENYGVAIVAGKGAGQTRRVLSIRDATLTVDRRWDVPPDSTSRYASFVWGLEKSLIKGNTFAQNPRGIWLYHTAVREVDVIGNRISEGGGIYLRGYQNLSTKSFMPIYNVLLARNQIVNTTGRWTSNMNAVFVNTDAEPFGIAMLGIEMRANQLTANKPNVSSPHEEYAGVEGYMAMMRVENKGGDASAALPGLLGTVITNNACSRCDIAVRVGTGAGGSTVLGTRLTDSAAAFADWATTSTPAKSTDTVVR